jgi:hypothetical protein
MSNLENLIVKDDDIEDNFDYEGIFDQKEDGLKKIGTMLDRSRMDVSYFMGTINRSRVNDDGIMNNTIHKHTDSQKSLSKVSQKPQAYHSTFKTKNANDSRIGIYKARNSLRVSSKPERHYLSKDNAKSRSLANIFMINNRTSDSESSRFGRVFH